MNYGTFLKTKVEVAPISGFAVTDNEIIKALKKWGKRHCKEVCPKIRPCETCVVNTIKQTLNIINRQKAEIERYKGVIKILENDVKDAREEAAKEFARMIIDKAESGVIHAMDIPDYVVEFLEEK